MLGNESTGSYGNSQTPTKTPHIVGLVSRSLVSYDAVGVAQRPWMRNMRRAREKMSSIDSCETRVFERE